MSQRIVPPGHGLPPIADRPARLLALEHAPDVVSTKTEEIYKTLLGHSDHLRTGNFTAIGVFDLEMMFAVYDRSFFDDLLSRMLRDDDAYPVEFRLSGRLTRSAGTTTRRRRRVPSPHGPVVKTEYAITISTTLLFATFRTSERSVTVSGLPVRDRLEALQRIFEHELLHLAENLAWGASSCARENFQNLSRRIFAHQAVHHELVTPREQAAVQHGIHVGDLVSFEHEGVRRVGLVNRITRRATVLVEDPKGRLYTNGKTFLTFYVPLPLLRKAP